MPKNPVKPVAKFVSRHRVAIAVAATFTVTVMLNRTALKQHNDFLKDHDLYEAFYAQFEEE
jgi:hypothetical protein